MSETASVCRTNRDLVLQWQAASNLPAAVVQEAIRPQEMSCGLASSVAFLSGSWDYPPSPCCSLELCLDACNTVVWQRTKHQHISLQPWACTHNPSSLTVQRGPGEAVRRELDKLHIAIARHCLLSESFELESTASTAVTSKDRTIAVSPGPGCKRQGDAVRSEPTRSFQVRSDSLLNIKGFESM